MHTNHTPEQNDEAVSPVIGVILMVAITVILAVVTIGYTMAMPQNLHSDTPIGITAGQLDENTVKITYIGPPRADEIAAITATLYAPDGTQLGTLTITDPIQGQAYSLSSGATPLSSALEHVVIVARYWDDDESVILDTYL